MIRFRQHRLLLTESLATEVEIQPSMAALLTEIKRYLVATGMYDPDTLGRELTAETMRIKHYGFDPRIQKDLWIVAGPEGPDYGVFGFMDGPLQS